MLILSMLLAQISVPSVAPTQATTEPTDKPIVVTAQSVESTRRALEACLAHQCTPREDIDASLAHAENEFVAGDYEAARATLTAARGRNARHAKDIPIEVADLSRANARMASLVGMPDIARVDAIETMEALRAGLRGDDPRILSERLAIGDAYARTGRFVAAIDVYREVATRARRNRHFVIEGNALFRIAAAYGVVSTRNAEYRDGARRAIAAIERTTEPELAPFRNGIILLRARLTGLDGDRSAMDTVIASGKATTRPMLLDALPMDLDERSVDFSFLMPGGAKAEWADVSFRIAPDGSVRDIDVVRKSKSLDTGWLDRATAALAKRRYARLDVDPTSPEIARVERFSFVHDVATVTGSRMRARSPRGRLDIIDLTQDPALPVAKPIG